MPRDNIVFNGEAFSCLRRCEECELCVRALGLDEVSELWENWLYENYDADSCICRIWEQLDDQDRKDVIISSYSSPTTPDSSLFASWQYAQVASSLPDGIDCIIDIGCYNAIQGVLFQNVRYIGVDDRHSPMIMHPHMEHHMLTAQEYLSTYEDYIDQEWTLALCFFVPDTEARQLVADTFKNCIILFKEAYHQGTGAEIELF